VTPTESIIASTQRTLDVRDGRGRNLRIRRLTALDTLRLLKAAGPILAQNQPWLSMAMLAVSVTEIDHIPVPTPTSEAQIESLVEKLGEDGMEAIADAVDQEPATTVDTTVTSAGN
jgi:hypothetical protein